MRGVILAAGLGSRMRELTKDVPKCLTGFKGRPLLSYQIEAMQGAGINEIAIVTGYKHEALAPLIRRYHLKEIYNARYSEENMVGSLMLAKKFIKGPSGAGRAIISYADIYYYTDALIRLMAGVYDINVLYHLGWLALWKRRFSEDISSDCESFRIDRDGFLEEIGAKVSPHEVFDIKGQFMGLLNISYEGLLAMEARYKDMPPSTDMTSLLNALLPEQRVFTIPFDGIFGEIDSPEDLEVLSS